MFVTEGFNQLKGVPDQVAETLCVVACDRQTATPFWAVRPKGADDRVSARFHGLG